MSEDQTPTTLSMAQSPITPRPTFQVMSTASDAYNEFFPPPDNRSGGQIADFMLYGHRKGSPGPDGWSSGPIMIPDNIHKLGENQSRSMPSTDGYFWQSKTRDHEAAPANPDTFGTAILEDPGKWNQNAEH
jgi:hypothetical protein